MQNKTCSTCQKTLPTSEFPIKRSNKDGLYSLCRSCKSLSDKASRQRRACSKPTTPKKCVSCGKIKGPDAYGKNKSKSDGLHDTCKPCKSTMGKNLYRRERTRILNANKQWRDSNKDKVLDRSQRYYKTNKPDFIARAAKRRSRKIKATPDWLTETHHREIQEFYWLAQDLKSITGESYHVDHIVPLKGKSVCGLHVPWNLQVLPADLNLSKGNKYGNLA